MGTEMDLMLDPSIRDWVLIPIVIIMCAEAAPRPPSHDLASVDRCSLPSLTSAVLCAPCGRMQVPDGHPSEQRY